jgi:hypothetical protein
MTNNETLELPKNTRLRSIYDNGETVYIFEKLKSVNNIVNAFVQKIDGNNIEIIKFPLNYFQNEFIIYVEEEQKEELKIIEEPVVEKKNSKK